VSAGLYDPGGRKLSAKLEADPLGKIKSLILLQNKAITDTTAVRVKETTHLFSVFIINSFVYLQKKQGYKSTSDIKKKQTTPLKSTPIPIYHLFYLFNTPNYLGVYFKKMLKKIINP